MFLIICTFLLAAYLFHLLYWRRRLLPPGPIPLPIVGNLHLARADEKPGYKTWKRFSEQYGPVFTFWLSGTPIVMVTDWDLIKHAFIKEGANYVDRPLFPFANEIKKGPYGVADACGERWQQHRRFVMQVFKEIINEFLAMSETVKKQQSENGKVDMMNIFDSSVGSIINTLLFGYRYDEDKMPEFLHLKGLLNSHFKAMSEPMCGLVMMYPWSAKLPFLQKYKKAIFDGWLEMLQFFRKQTEEKLKYIDYENNEYSDYVEAFLKERKKHENEPNYGRFEMEQLENVCFDLWVAGMETTSNTLYWALLYVLVNDDVRKKVYEELDSKIGNDRIITTSDRNNLDYINATINESQRLANILPVTLFRLNIVDVKIGGHTIPKGTVLNPQIGQVLYNEEVFPKPYEFKPERFLDKYGKLRKIEEFVPFSVGKRQCLGEGLAKMELFLFFANFFNRFDISLHSSNPKPSVEKDAGITMKARNYNINVKSRF